MDVSIVIPVKNGGEILDQVLESIYSQMTSYTYEVICIDSGSKDNSLDIIKKYDARLYTILPSEFGHGKTRNYGASKGTGEFIVFITQDALPATKNWLQNLIDAMKLDDNIAGGFGIHYPYPDCNTIDTRDITAHFNGFGNTNTIYFLEDHERYKIDEGYRHFLAFFSDNNSCLRRSVWEKIPYEDVNFAEDQIWARTIIEKGYKKIYCPHAPVYHSHNYKLSTYFKRYFDEYKGLYEIHGYKNAERKRTLIKYMLFHILKDIKYVVKLKKLTVFSKIYNIFYVTCREFCRYVGGYIGGRYHSYDIEKKEKYDKRFSQQREQRMG